MAYLSMSYFLSKTDIEQVKNAKKSFTFRVHLTTGCFDRYLSQMQGRGSKGIGPCGTPGSLRAHCLYEKSLRPDKHDRCSPRSG